MTMWEQRRAWAGMAALLVGTLVVASCADDDLTGASDLMGGTWRLQSLALSGAAEFVPPDPERFTVNFTSAGRVEVVADCNSCGGAFSVGEDTLTRARADLHAGRVRDAARRAVRDPARGDGRRWTATGTC